MATEVKQCRVCPSDQRGKQRWSGVAAPDRHDAFALDGLGHGDETNRVLRRHDGTRQRPCLDGAGQQNQRKTGYQMTAAVHPWTFFRGGSRSPGQAPRV